MKTYTMEQIKQTEMIEMIEPTEWANTHIESHERINSAVTQFYWLFNDLISQINNLANIDKDAEERSVASFSKVKDEIKELRKELKCMAQEIKEIKVMLDEWWHFETIRYQWMIDTDSETTVELDPIKDVDLKWRWSQASHLANIVIDEVKPNQWTMTYSFPQTRLVHWERKPEIHLVAKEWQHAVLEYDFRIILTEV